MTTVDQYTQIPINRPGTFRAWPVAWTLEAKEDTAESKAVALAFKFAIGEGWDPQNKTWTAYAPGWYVDGRVWIVKKDGNLNVAAIENLIKLGLWDGEFETVEQQAPPSMFVHVTVDPALNQDKTPRIWTSGPAAGQPIFQANWINPDTDEPVARGAFQPVAPEMVQNLRGRFGTQIRAIAGGNRNGQPPAPPPMPGQMADQQHAAIATGPGAAAGGSLGLAPTAQPQPTYAPPAHAQQPQHGHAVSMPNPGPAPTPLPTHPHAGGSPAHPTHAPQQHAPQGTPQGGRPGQAPQRRVPPPITLSAPQTQHDVVSPASGGPDDPAYDEPPPFA